MQRNLIRSIVLLFLMKDGKICLGKRQNTGSMDGCWALPAGHVEAGESAMQGMIREAKEETGIDIDPADLTCELVSYRRTEGIKGEAVDFFFSCEQWQGEVINAEPEKCEGWAFFDFDDLPTPMVPSQVAAIKAWRAGKRYSEFGFER